MHYKQYPVDPSLSKWIRYFWSYDLYTSEVQSLQVRSFADLYPRLVFQDIHCSSFIKDTVGNTKPICYLSGIDTVPTETFWDSRFSHFGVSFYPHALHAFFGLNASQLTDQTPDIQLVVKEELTSLLIGAREHQERVSILHRYFYEKITSRNTDLIVQDLFLAPWPVRLNSEIRLATLAKYYGLSERQLQRRFKHSVGVSARKYAQLVKFERSLQILPTAEYGNLTSLSYRLGYADQSHFIHDFKQFSGVSPYEFVRSNTVGSESASYIYLA